jgi:4-aminobutyrate aminotransferase-like enzyme/Ser/Thr protein kinase RdoA (MazF antagonist)
LRTQPAPFLSAAKFRPQATRCETCRGGTPTRKIDTVAAAPTQALSVLEAPPPRFSLDEAARIAAEQFELAGIATDLGSERDQTFLIDDGGAGGVLKISNVGEDAGTLDLEAAAIAHVLRVDRELPVARPVGGRRLVEGPDGKHFVRLFERLHGHFGGPELDERALFEYGAMHARLNLALRAFFHPAAGRRLLWDLNNTLELRPLVPAIGDAERRQLVESVLDGFEQRVVPMWSRLRAQVVHGDFNLDNILLDERDRVAGIVDFGDTGHSAQAGDLAIGLASLMRGRKRDDVFRAARIAIDGYESRLPLEPEERQVLGDLVAARLAAIVAISAWRVERYPENAEYIQAWDADSWALLELFAEAEADAVSYAFGAERPTAPTAELGRRRRATLGAALTPPTYRQPVHLVRGEGVWLFDADGRRLLDAYNNVPVVGHCHPRVTEAVVRQTRRLNTHARYLYEPLIELAERLAASMPIGSGLDTVMLVNSGSEANELAWRVATTLTGHRGAVVTEHAYHGVTTAMADLSPEEWRAGCEPSHVARLSPPALELGGALARLADIGVAATFVDAGFASDGIRVPPPAALEAVVRETHAAGGLFVADEVQAGHGRSGEHLWAFARYGITPDVVTLGKPMGNGYPVAAVVTRAEICERFAERTHVFSTFGGNPVAAQAALAVLDVIEDERLIENARRVGTYLHGSLQGLGVQVRSLGLLVGVELASPELADGVVNRLREAGILIGRTGSNGSVLKIRPPLVFQEEHVDTLVEALADAL